MNNCPDKDLYRPEPLLCPACKSSTIHFGNYIPYYKTHQKWNTDINDFHVVVPEKYKSSIFEIYYCKACDFVYVPASYKDIVHIVEEHPLFIEKIIKPYLVQTQKQISKDYVTKILSADLNSLDTVEQRYKKCRAVIASFIDKTSSFLDLGCNFGSFTELIRISFPEIKVFGCEIGKYYANECLRRYPNLILIEEKISENKIIGPFDFIYCSDVLEHIWDIDDFIEGIKVNLNINRHLMIVTPNLDCIESKVKGTDWWAYIVPHHAQIFNLKSLNALMLRHGFALVESEPIFEEFWAIYRI